MNSNDDVDVARMNRLVLENIPMTYVKLSVTIYKNFGNFLNLKYLNNEDAINTNEQKEFEYIFSLGLKYAKENLNHDSTLLHKGKKPRKDVWVRLGRMVNELMKCENYPIIPSYKISSILNKALGDRDVRVIDDYKETLLQYCNTKHEYDNSKVNKFGYIDVTLFVHMVPKKFIELATSTSSFLEKEYE